MLRDMVARCRERRAAGAHAVATLEDVEALVAEIERLERIAFPVYVATLDEGANVDDVHDPASRVTLAG